MIEIGKRYSLNQKSALIILISQFLSFIFCISALIVTHIRLSSEIKSTEKGAKILVSRRNILDRNGIPLAFSAIKADIYVHPNRIDNKPEIAYRLARLLNLKKSDVIQTLQSGKKFAVVARSQDLALAKLVAKEFEQPELVYYEKKVARYYKFPKTLDPLIGKVSVDGQGLYGIEYLLNEQLIVSDRSRFKDMDDVYLTIDAEIQHLLDKIIQQAFDLHEPEAILGVIVNAGTGELLAYSQLDKSNRLPPSLKLTEYVYEPGSTFKPISLAIALDQRAVRLNDSFNCHFGKFKFGGYMIKDVHPYGQLSFKEVLAKSSNICTGLISLKVDRSVFLDYLKNFGFGSKVWRFAGESKGIIFDKSNFKAIDQFVTSFGQGIAVTPLQLIQAFTAFLNSGLVVKPFYILNQKTNSFRVLSPDTSKQIKNILIYSVENGTGKSAAVPGYIVGGKTGTAQKPEIGGKGYKSGKYVSSFIGFVEINEIPIIGLFIVDEPAKGEYLGGRVAAPLFSEFFGKFLNYGLHKKVYKNSFIVMNDNKYYRS